MTVPSPRPPARPVLIGLLAAFSAAGPATTQMFLPVLPHVQQDFEVSVGLAQLSLSVGLLSAAVVPLLAGSLSDRFGRRPLAVGAAVLFLVGSVISLLAPNVWVLIVGRVVQAGAGATGIVLSRAIVQDVYGSERAVSAMAAVIMAMSLAPMLTPLIGGVLADAFGWRAALLVIAGFGAALLAAIVVILEETRLDDFAVREGVGRAMVTLLRLPLFHVYSMQSAFTMGMFFAFVSAAPYVVVNILHRPAAVYGTGFLAVAAGYVVGNAFAGRYSRRIGTDRMVFWATLASLAAVAWMAALLFSGVWSVWSVFAPGVVAAIGIGASIPNATAAATAICPPLAGAASGLSSFMQLLVGAVTAQAVGTAITTTPYPMAAAMLVLGALAFVAIAVRSRVAPPPPATEGS